MTINAHWQKKKRVERTAVENKLKFNKLQIYQIWRDGFMGNPHTNMFDFNCVSGKWIIKPVLKVYEIWYLNIKWVITVKFEQK